MDLQTIQPAWPLMLLAALIAGLLSIDGTRCRAETSRPSIPVVPMVPAGRSLPATTLQSQLARLAVVERPDRLSALAPPTYANAPRGFGPNYFERGSYAGPSRRGRAYDVRRRFDG